ncbi:efflux RND transporter periplasmic adaptor subunit [Microvirga massiliensis]|uniref:efflux RND transporter periplasmic adaptor subunit n=1 Tax=Microvirga massiliensis TaxID=1033741 RepID=UPI0006609069|nr:efflux RND transporter periplasmic adaptor subunit [Microvirga massiliensis]
MLEGSPRESHESSAAAKWVVGLAFVIFLSSVRWEVPSGIGGQERTLRYASVVQGDIVRGITAAGTLEAVDTVEISSQLSGQIAKVMADHNSMVREGDPLAALDSATYEASVQEAKAALKVAEAELEDARAAIEGVQVRYDEALRDFEAKSSLSRGGATSPREVDRARAAAQALAAELASTKAREQVRSAQTVAARAALTRAEIDLRRTVIRSPINGIVIRRSVELGQTVASSFQAPTLFTLARDLADMRVNASVNEADIGSVQVGQRTTFAVDAYPGRSFGGRVLEIRKAPHPVQNVVTYTVIASALNPDGLLLPGMTADLQIVIQEHHDVMVVPNAALSFDRASGGRGRSVEPGKGVLWVLTQSGGLAETTVSLGASSDSLTEIVSPDLRLGEQVALGYRD